MNDILEKIKAAFGDFSPNLLGALAILVFGWLIALFVSALVRQILRRTTLDNRLALWLAGGDTAKGLQAEAMMSKAVFYVLMLFVVAAFFYTLKLPAISEPLNLITSSITAYLPRLISAAILVLIAWVLATVLKKVAGAILHGAKLDEKLGGSEAGSEKAKTSVSATLADAVYWLVFVLFLPAILGALDLKALLEPVTALFNKVFSYLPQIIGAAIILLVGWFVARIVQRIVTSLLASTGVDGAAKKWGLALGKLTLSGLIGLILYYCILLPVLVSALNALQLEAITTPASDMLGKIMNMLPAIIGAALVVGISFLVGRLVSGIVTNVLTGVGFNNVLVKLGIARQAGEGDRAPAALVGKLILLSILLFASIEAASLMGFSGVSELIRNFVGFAGHVLLGLIVFGFGLLLANWVAGVLRASDSRNAALLATAARIVVLLLAGAMALRQMELANDIVNLAFGLAIGAVAVAIALAFGLGGRDSAARLLADWRQQAGPVDPEKRP